MANLRFRVREWEGNRDVLATAQLGGVGREMRRFPGVEMLKWETLRENCVFGIVFLGQLVWSCSSAVHRMVFLDWLLRTLKFHNFKTLPSSKNSPNPFPRQPYITNSICTTTLSAYVSKTPETKTPTKSCKIGSNGPASNPRLNIIQWVLAHERNEVIYI